MNDFVRNILQYTFYAYCYIFLSGTRRCTHSYLRRCYATYSRCHWCRNPAAVNYILHWI